VEKVINRLRESQTLAKLVGEAPSFIRAVCRLPEIAKSDATVLIDGETGTGKELVARAIHYLSPRSAFPFIPVNCGSLPDFLVEDELFGHERGAFTDARLRRSGLIAEADKGTLFLDEIDTLPRKAQSALLRVLQERRFRAVGSDKEQDADIRVVAATNTPLKELVQSHAFRADLYYRLCVFFVQLPPLRERREDILPLASHFLQKYAADNQPAPSLTSAASIALMAYDWPGNIRELENAILRASRLCQGEMVSVDDLGLWSVAGESPPTQPDRRPQMGPLKTLKRQMIEGFEKNYLTRLMCEHSGNVSEAARAAGKERRELGKLLKKYHVNPKHYVSITESPT
jgi:DNA-binding NtrC family response regulator